MWVPHVKEPLLVKHKGMLGKPGSHGEWGVYSNTSCSCPLGGVTELVYTVPPKDASDCHDTDSTYPMMGEVS